ncbi:MAG: pilus assembly protein CpaB, partial [Microbacterium sp.]
MPSVPAALHAVRRRLLIHRRGLAALCVAVLTWSVLATVRPSAPPSATVWTAVRELPSGTVLSAADLHATRVPPGAAPEAAHDLGSLTGRVLAAPLGTGEVATATQLMGNGHLAGYPGRSAVPLRIPDAATVGLLHTGDRVDLVASDPQSPRRGTRIATDAVVLAIPPAAAPGSAPALEGRLVVFAVPSQDVVEVAAAATGLFLN